MEKEIWKDIEGFEGYYQVSTFGRVRSIRTGQLLKPRKALNGYYHISCCVKGKTKVYRIHRLVAETFIPKPIIPKEIDAFDGTEYDIELEVNHKDENKENNRLDNLEWCTRKYNIRYGSGIKRAQKGRVENKQKHRFEEPIPDGTVLLWD